MNELINSKNFIINNNNNNRNNENLRKFCDRMHENVINFNRVLVIN